MGIGSIERIVELFHESALEAADQLRRGNGFFRRIVDALPAAVYITDAQGKITYYNEAAATLWGHHPPLGEAEWCGSWRLFSPDGEAMPHEQCPMALAIKHGQPPQGMEAIAERPDGTRVSFLPFPTLLHNSAGVLVGAVNMLVDITDRKRAEDYAQRLASIVEFSDDAIVSKDLDGTIESWNRGAERLFGYSAEEVRGKPITILIPPDRLGEETEILRRIRRGEVVNHFETQRRRKDGSLIEISVTISPVKNAQGRIVGASKIARDISDRRRAQEQESLLFEEMRHRIKNTLATVQAIASQTMHSASDADRAAFGSRLQALARSHDLLTLESWRRASLSSVVNAAVEAFRSGRQERIIVDGRAEVWLDATKSGLMTIILHELATNAAKYGALSNDSGRVHIGWEQVLQGPSGGRLALSWRETGGPPVVPPTHKGFGSRLIDSALSGEAGCASLEFDPEGFSCRLELAL